MEGNVSVGNIFGFHGYHRNQEGSCKTLFYIFCVGSKTAVSAKTVNTRTPCRIQYSIFQVRQEIGDQMTKLNTLYIELSSALIERSTKDEILTAQIENIQNQIDLLRKIVAMRNSENL